MIKKVIISIVVLVLLFISTGCTSKNIVRSGHGDMVLEYTSQSLYGTMEDSNNIYYIRLYDDKTINVGNNNTNQKVDVDFETYQKIINYAFSSSFVNLNEDLSDKGVMDGSKQFITLYFEDGSSKKIGGNNPSNKSFKKLYKMLVEACEDLEEK